MPWTGGAGVDGWEIGDNLSLSLYAGLSLHHRMLPWACGSGISACADGKSGKHISVSAARRPAAATQIDLPSPVLRPFRQTKHKLRVWRFKSMQIYKIMNAAQAQNPVHRICHAAPVNQLIALMTGAAKRTRTSTPFPGLPPQGSASTSSAMAAV